MLIEQSVPCCSDSGIKTNENLTWLFALTWCQCVFTFVLLKVKSLRSEGSKLKSFIPVDTLCWVNKGFPRPLKKQTAPTKGSERWCLGLLILLWWNKWNLKVFTPSGSEMQISANRVCALASCPWVISTCSKGTFGQCQRGGVGVAKTLWEWRLTSAHWEKPLSAPAFNACRFSLPLHQNGRSWRIQ